MAKLKKKQESSKFIFKDFSRKQLQAMNWWRPQNKTSMCDMIICDGSVRSGKTICMIIGFLLFSQEMYTGETFIIAGKTIGSLKKNVIQPMKSILNAWGWEYEHNRTENYLVIDTNIYYMYDASNESSQDKLQGLTAAGALADEVALFPKNFVEQMIARCSVKGSKLWLNCNPGGTYHWLKTEYIDKCFKKLIYHLHFTMDDNLSLDENIKKRYERMYTGVFYLRYVLGLWVQAEGVIYSMFDKAKNTVTKSLETKYERYYISIDYGILNPMAFLLWGKKGNKHYLIKEYYYSGRDTGIQKSDNKYYDDLEAFAYGYNIEFIVIDPSASSFIQLIREKKKFKVRKANNDVINGIRNVMTALNEQIIVVDRDCKNTLKEFSSYLWDEKASKRGEDIPLKEHDHCMDAIRYFVHTIIFKGKTNEYDKEVTSKGLGVIEANQIQNELKKLEQLYKKGGNVF